MVNQLSHANIMAVLLESNGARWFVSSRGLNRLQNGQIEVFNPDTSFIPHFKTEMVDFGLVVNKGCFGSLSLGDFLKHI